MKAYKVVTKCTNSSTSSSFTGEFALKYLMNKKIKPKIGKIFVFKTQKSAEIFAEKLDWYYFTVVEGEAEKCTSISKICKDMSAFDFEQFWKAKKNHKKPTGIPLMKPPEGTLVCSSFTPERIVPFSWENKGQK